MSIRHSDGSQKLIQSFDIDCGGHYRVRLVRQKDHELLAVYIAFGKQCLRHVVISSGENFHRKYLLVRLGPAHRVKTRWRFLQR